MLFAFVVGGLGFEFCVFVAGWRHALRSEWPFIINSGTECYFLPKVVLFISYLNGSLCGPALETSRFDKGCNIYNRHQYIHFVL